MPLVAGVPRGRGLLAWCAAATVVAWIAAGPSEPEGSPPVAPEPRVPIAVQRPALHEQTGTVTAVQARAGSGSFIVVAEVRHGDRFGVLVPND